MVLARGAFVALAMIVVVPAAHAALWTPGVFQPGLNTMGPDLRDVDFWSYDEGLAVGAGYSVYRTTDLGQTWTRTFPPEDVSGPGWRTVRMTGPGEAWVGGSDAIFQALVAHTVDGGANWEGASFYIDGNEGIVWDIDWHRGRVIALFTYWFGAGGVIASIDGGHNWTQLLFSEQPLLSIDIEADQMIVVGGDGDILYSFDGGASWDEAVTPTNQMLWSVNTTSSAPGKVYAVGDAGTVLRSEDGGHTWVSLASGTTANLRDVVFPTPTTGYAVGEGGIILRTIDGTVWTPEPAAAQAHLNGVDALPLAGIGGDVFVKAVRPVAVGDGGTIRTGLDVALN